MHSDWSSLVRARLLAGGVPIRVFGRHAAHEGAAGDARHPRRPHPDRGPSRCRRARSSRLNWSHRLAAVTAATERRPEVCPPTGRAGLARIDLARARRSASAAPLAAPPLPGSSSRGFRAALAGHECRTAAMPIRKTRRPRHSSLLESDYGVSNVCRVILAVATLWRLRAPIRAHIRCAAWVADVLDSIERPEARRARRARDAP